MNKIRIKPSKLKGNVVIPPSKSMAHRAIICASLADGESILTGVDYSEDIIATIKGMRALGATVIEQKDTLTIKGIHTAVQSNHLKEIDCNESGSTLRFLVPISLINPQKVRFIGKGNLGKRPLTPFYTIFDEQQIEYTYKINEMDLSIEGQLKSGIYKLEGNISSQFISGLLFSLPLLEGDSQIILTTPLESKGYIDLTLQMMKRFGVEIQCIDNRTFHIKGNQCYKSSQYSIEGDYSQSAFFFVGSAIGNDICCQGLEFESLQGDRAALPFLQEMGAKVEQTPENITIKGAELKGITIDGSECPDIIPVMTVAAALSMGKTHIIRAERLRIKECDRLYAIVKELNAIGANIIEEKDGMIIHGVQNFKGGCTVSSHKDHRIAMSLAIAATRCEEPIVLEHPECVSKSYPGFWEDYKSLGGMIEEVSYE